MPLRLASAAAFAALALPAGAVTCDPAIAYLTRPDGSHAAIRVEIADDPEERARGLMYRTDLAPGHGMLFVYDTPQVMSFWMRNTLMPLDILFFDATGRLAHVHAGAKPLDETAIPGAAPGDPAPERVMALEVGGGEAARLGLLPGTLLSHPALDPALAAAPCD